MSKIDILIRHSIIIQRIRQNGATLKEINHALAKASEYEELELTVSARTFARDIHDISTIWKISIACEKGTNKYYIETMDEGLPSFQLLDSFITAYAINSTTGYNQYVHLEDYANNGAEYFNDILQAIKNKVQIHIYYQSYWSDTGLDRIINPYFLKEFKNRWYLIGLDEGKQVIRIFGLDRIKKLTVSRKKFSFPENEQPQNYFEDCFGIISKEEGQELETILLSFTAGQGKYIKSLPLHHSQQVLKDDANGLIISVKVYATYDLIREILSHGDKVKVLEPKSLVNLIKKILSESLNQY